MNQREIRAFIYRSQKEVDEKIDLAHQALANDDLDQAEKLEKEISELKALIKEKEEELKKLKGQENEKMNRSNKTPNAHDYGFNPNHSSQEVRDFEHYIQTKEIREGLKTDSGYVVIPEEIVTEIQQIIEDELKLSDYVTVRNVEYGKGKVPLLKQDIQPLPLVEELQENPALSVTPYQEVEYNIKTHRGFLLVSKEALEDEKSGLVKLIKDYFARSIVSTENKAILESINSLEKIDATGIDGIKDVLNKRVLPNYKNNVILLNQSAFNVIDKLKDNNGRYLLQEKLADPTAKHISGASVVIVPDSVLPSNDSEGTHPVVVGNLKDAIVLFRRSKYEAQWTDYMHFGDGYMVAVRQDSKAFNKSSAFVLNFKEA